MCSLDDEIAEGKAEYEAEHNGHHQEPEPKVTVDKE
jgi:hypothetical protein